MLLILLACKSAEAEEDPSLFTERGEHAVGARTFTLSREGRDFEVEVWYPSPQGDQGHAVQDFLDDERAETYGQLLDAAPADCPTRSLSATRDATPTEGTWPLVVFSHCHECVRFSAASVAEHLASQGFVVAAPDHEGNTLFDGLAEAGLPLNSDTLAIRGQDMVDALDFLLSGQAGVDIDPSRIGAMGHSFGAVTTGWLLQQDGRPIAGMAMAAPMDNPLLPGVDIEALAQPLFFLLAQEDNSITELGNELIRSNHDEAASSILVEVPDAGHWSFSDLCGLHEPFDPGCGQGERQTNGEPFSYLPADQGRQIARETASAFFHGWLMDQPYGLEWLALR